jgi:hypothetical protein
MLARARDPSVVLFVGPTMATSARARALARSVEVRRPVRRGDIAALVEAGGRRRDLVIVDGVFHDSLAVGHAEIRAALARGWRVWGLGSMGAIRAREMAHMGMRGFGRVFERFMAEGDYQDDEVALLHEPGRPYRPVSEPLVHLRAAIDHLVTVCALAPTAADTVVADLKSRWYGERTIRRLFHALRPVLAPAVLDRELRDFDRFRTKTIDLVDFLELRPFAGER